MHLVFGQVQPRPVGDRHARSAVGVLVKRNNFLLCHIVNNLLALHPAAVPHLH